MDTLSHGLWGGIAFGRQSKFSYWLSFVFGVAPDLFSFGIFFLERIFTGGLDFSGPPDISTIPQYVYTTYDITHSFVVFAAAFIIARLIWKRWIWEMLAWPFHIVLDIFTHSEAFFPTPFLWPVSDFRFSGTPWSDPRIFFPNVALLLILYIAFYISKKKNRAA